MLLKRKCERFKGHQDGRGGPGRQGAWKALPGKSGFEDFK